MKSANVVGLVQAITSAILILLLVYQQADCVGLSHHQRTARLTTFGGSQNTASKNNSTTQQKKISGKLCKNDSECKEIANTTCMRHPDDNIMRCLCGEKKSPHNGACRHSKQGLHHKCNVDNDCIRNAECKANNVTKERVCECMEDYEEEEHECSSSPLTRVPVTQAVFLLLFSPILHLIQ